ncbi:hypothetical protein A0J61_04158 [Choanephora cucurbitarum]|uniref:F-box domain-containing protein n=1 Tax=Choanephora cucurbitarum TaxID=101091 RepID=A0A1C7NKI8_9FUNG|nr:hypothetical protein A0J61_04158 [Choanephora cucurbitarum]
MRVDLPFDVHLIILSYLDKLDKHQYGLVCKQWYEPAKHAIFRVTSVTVEKKLDAFVDALATSNIGNYISELRLYMGHRTKGWSPSLMEKRKKQFAALIKHTPNLNLLEVGTSNPDKDENTSDRVAFFSGWRDKKEPEAPVEKGVNPFYQVVLESIRNGHWKALHSIDDDLLSENCKEDSEDSEGIEDYLTPYYNAIISAMQERISYVVLDVTTTPELPLMPQCFKSSVKISKDTQFPKVKHLGCYSSEKTTIQTIDDVLELCPAATQVSLSLNEFHKNQGELKKVKPNTLVTNLRVIVFSLTESFLNYMCRKFPNANKLDMIVLEGCTMKSVIEDEDEDDFAFDSDDDFDVGSRYWLEIPTKMIQQLATYVKSMERFLIRIHYVANRVEVFDIFNKTLSPIKLYTRLDGLTIGTEPKKTKSTLQLDPNVTNIKLTATTKAALNQLDELFFDLNNIEPTVLPSANYRQLLTHCKQLKELSFSTFILYDFPKQTLPVTHLTIHDCEVDRKLWKQFSRQMPQLTNMKILFDPNSEGMKERDDNVFKIDMPFTSFSRLEIEYMLVFTRHVLYLKVTRSGTTTYYCQYDEDDEEVEGPSKKLKEITKKEYQGCISNEEFGVVELICQDIKHLRVHCWDVNDGFEFEKEHQFN